jgi:hypothetical protein
MEAILIFFTSFLATLTSILTSSEIFLMEIAIAAFASMTIDLLIKNNAIYRVKTIVDYNLPTPRWWENIEIMILSHTLFTSSTYKKTIRLNKNGCENSNYEFRSKLLSIFIKKSNKLNLGASLCLLLALPTATFFSNKFFFDVFLYLAIIRATSRSVEMIFAFSLDVIEDTPPKTPLNKHDRIKLAINSYFENIINYAFIYMTYNYNESLFQKGILDSIGRGTLTNINIDKSTDFVLQYIIYLQAFTSIVLITLSLAIYVGRKR